jgi:hypothetical protein
MTEPFTAEGGCGCSLIRYRMESTPLFVHCCHCRWCQRESGASFALNAMIEADRVTNLGAEPEVIDTPSESGLGQKVARCPNCRVAVWSHYAGSGPVTKFVRVGTLDQPDLLPPDVHIFTASKQPWVALPAGVPAFAEFYDRDEIWPQQSLARRAAVLPQIEAYQAGLRNGS